MNEFPSSSVLSYIFKSNLKVSQLLQTTEKASAKEEFRRRLCLLQDDSVATLHSITTKLNDALEERDRADERLQLLQRSLGELEEGSTVNCNLFVCVSEVPKCY